MLALRVAEESGFAAGALAPDDVGLARALPAKLGAVVAQAASHVAVTLQRTAVEPARH